MAYNVFNRSRMPPQMAVPGGSMRMGIIDPYRTAPPQAAVDGGSMRQGIVNAPTMREALVQTQPQKSVAEILSETSGGVSGDLRGATNSADRQRQIADMLLEGAQGRQATDLVTGFSKLGEAFIARGAGKKADAAEAKRDEIVSMLTQKAMQGDEASIAALLSPEAAIGRRDVNARNIVEDEFTRTQLAQGQQGLDQDADQFGQTIGLQRDQFETEQERADRLEAEDARRFGLTYGLNEREVAAAEERARAEAEGAKINVDDESTFRREYNSIVSGFRDVQASYGRIKATDATTPAGQLSLVYQYMKMLDPGSTVMQGEQASAQNAGAVDDKTRNLYNAIVGGKKLAPEQVTDFINQADLLYERSLQDYDKARTTYEGLANLYGYDPARVVPDFATGRTASPGDVAAPPANLPPPPEGYDDAEVPWADAWAEMTPAERALFAPQPQVFSNRITF